MLRHVASRQFVFTLVLAIAAAMPAIANETHPNLDAAAILDQQRQIRVEVEQRSGRYKDMPSAERTTLLREQDKVFTLLRDRSAITDLPEADRIVVFNSLESISAIVNRAPEEKLVCERTRKIGSNRTETVCMTASERRARREADAKALGDRNAACLKSNSDCI
ncbi:hypothetical protein [Lysobacter auxotrophicus]|uniref:Secreted protein n=1 Tax=Lysobacter auxotrophicus TaxID=2992573 RepID=A0ABM8D9Z1_9GAMM|nr:hypothetical protein [Lysobacter auxotrophicus]BDU15340.1 hypothetical protein LA521A_05410 [Lysobacter auxotrophicus]